MRFSDATTSGGWKIYSILCNPPPPQKKINPSCAIDKIHFYVYLGLSDNIRMLDINCVCQLRRSILKYIL